MVLKYSVTKVYAFGDPHSTKLSELEDSTLLARPGLEERRQ